MQSKEAIHFLQRHMQGKGYESRPVNIVMTFGTYFLTYSQQGTLNLCLKLIKWNSSLDARILIAHTHVPNTAKHLNKPTCIVYATDLNAADKHDFLRISKLICMWKNKPSNLVLIIKHSKIFNLKHFVKIINPWNLVVFTPNRSSEGKSHFAQAE